MPFDGEACPTCSEEEDWITKSCWGERDSRGCAWTHAHCLRHQDQANAMVDESQEWLRKRRAVPQFEWELLDLEFDAIQEKSLGLSDDERDAMLQPWYEKRDAVIEKYNQQPVEAQ